MSESENLNIVRGIFEAFGRGDVPSVLEALSEDVRWDANGPAHVPHFGSRSGHDGAREFFTQLGSSVEFTRFEVEELVAGGDKVFALGTERGRVRATGREFDNDWCLVFTLRGGKVARFQAYEDTAAVAEAFGGA